MSLFRRQKRDEIPSSDPPMDLLPPAVRPRREDFPPSFPRLAAPPVAPREPPQPIVVHVHFVDDKPEGDTT